MNENSSKPIILLLDGGSVSKGRVRQWLNKCGMIAWEANDVCHAIEELSDFTVKNRPDVVLLEVASLPECFDLFRSTFESSVLALTDTITGPEAKPYVAHDLDQLRAIMRRTPSYSA
jgi:hypothetical protein